MWNFEKFLKWWNSGPSPSRRLTLGIRGLWTDFSRLSEQPIFRYFFTLRFQFLLTFSFFFPWQQNLSPKNNYEKLISIVHSFNSEHLLIVWSFEDADFKCQIKALKSVLAIFIGGPFSVRSIELNGAERSKIFGYDQKYPDQIVWSMAGSSNRGLLTSYCP